MNFRVMKAYLQYNMGTIHKSIKICFFNSLRKILKLYNLNST